MELADWIEGYARAWREGDPEAVVALLTEDASYRSSPFGEVPNLGHDGIRAYWTRATDSQEDVEVEMGEPLVDGNVVAVEWWTRMRSEGQEVTLVGCLLLRMAPDGRCEDLREYWNYEAGRLPPHPGWGSWEPQ
jgi:ketosteroid isomerase-like protein